MARDRGNNRIPARELRGKEDVGDLGLPVAHEGALVHGRKCRCHLGMKSYGCWNLRKRRGDWCQVTGSFMRDWEQRICEERVTRMVCTGL